MFSAKSESFIYEFLFNFISCPICHLLGPNIF